LRLDDRGGVTIGVHIFDRTAAPADPRLAAAGAENVWKIEFVHLEVHGEIPSR
jgi:hypothetical protein